MNKKVFDFHRIQINEHVLMVLLAILVGLAGGFGAVGFRYLINFIQTLSYGSENELLNTIQTIPLHYRIWVPAAGGLVIGPMIYFWAREAKGHGVPEVMEAVALRGGLIRKRVVFIKTLASAICIGTGGSVGREGPIVQIGSAIGSAIGQLLKVSAERMRTLVGCGAAAGIAATFNAPIAGSMFALEIILGDFGLKNFSPIVIASVVATAISRHFLGDTPAFIVPAYELVSTWELPLYVVMGLFCAAVGVGFTLILYRAEDLFAKFRFPEYLKPVVGGFILGIAALFLPHILGVGYGTIDLVWVHKLSWWLMLVLILGKILSTSVTIGSGGSGGIFAPSLFIGAMAGGFFGTIVHTLFPSMTAAPGAYSLVGMGAVVSATTHGPMTAILMLFEMTGDYKIILPLMVVCIISTLFSGKLSKESIYTFKLVRRGVDLRGGKEVNVLKSMAVKDVMNTNIETIPKNLSLAKMAAKISRSKYNSFPVIDAQNKLCGMLSFKDYKDALFDESLKDLVLATDIATAEVLTITDDSDLYTALQTISRKDFSTLPVVSPDDPKRLVGVVTRRDIIGAYEKAVIKKTLFAK
jgi:chloride channel protein, CIC family